MFSIGLGLINELHTSQKLKLPVWKQIAEKLAIRMIVCYKSHLPFA